jgi:hypothetical protein
VVCAVVWAVPSLLAAQEPPAAPPAPAVASDPPPSRLAEVELARSRSCVSSLAMLARLDEELAPLFRRADRIQALNAAVLLEDTTRVTPLDPGDSLEVAVRDWFVADYALAMEAASAGAGAEAIQQRRAEARERIRQRLQETLTPLRAEVEERVAAAGDVDSASGLCEGAIFVRSAVIEACQTVESPICAPARTPEPDGPYGFVDSPTDLWDLEQLRPWSDPVALSRTPDGGLAGARAASLTRRGNVVLIVGVEPMLRSRESLSAEQLAEMDANLDSMGIPFEDTRFAMAPVMTIQVSVPERLGDETHYALHFGDMTNPVDETIWTIPAPEKGPVEAVVPAAGWVFSALARGDAVTFSALRSVEGRAPERVYALGITPLGQAQAVGAVLTYMTSGQLGRDLTTVIPPSPPGQQPPAPPPPPPPPGGER